jgi:hypothetical protein
VRAAYKRRDRRTIAGEARGPIAGKEERKREREREKEKQRHQATAGK